MTKDIRKFYPVHSGSQDTCPRPGQRYRFAFNDRRLAARVDTTVTHLCRYRSCKVQSLTPEHKVHTATYRLLDNERIDLAELIGHCCDISPEQIGGKAVLVCGDGSSLNTNLSGRGRRRKWAKDHSCLANSKVSGFQFMAGLTVDQRTHDIIGLSDMLIYDSPRDFRSQEKRHAERFDRSKLPLTEKESGMWTILADNSMSNLAAAKQVTFVFDREADSYENMAYLRQITKADFIIRQKYERKASLDGGGEFKLSELLQAQQWQGVRSLAVSKLDHYSHTKGSTRIREARQAILNIRFLKVRPSLPGNYHKYQSNRLVISQPLYLVEVMEDASSVPKGEQPIRWKLWTTWQVTDVETAWQVVDAYRARWNVEELFRLLKTGGMNIEISQLGELDRIKRLLIMSAKASAEALKLVKARDGVHFVPISEMFSDKETELLNRLNGKLSKTGTALENPHGSDGLAFAAWIVARLGGWEGYQSQRPPGPITMHRGLLKFYELFEWRVLLEDL